MTARATTQKTKRNAESAQARRPAKKKKLLPGLHVDEGYIQHPFDAEYGVRTSGLIVGRALKSGHHNDRHNTAYYGVAPSIFQRILAQWRRYKPAAPLSEYTFVDLGAGMGRALLLASEHGFRQCIGVEMNPTLAAIARRNNALWRKADRAESPLRLLCRDAVEYKLPAGPCAIFLFNPFGAPVLKRLLTQWDKQLRGREGQVDLLYVNNEQERTLRCQSGWTRLFAGEIRRSRADAIADRDILNNQPDGEYMAANWEDCSIYRWTGNFSSF
jgi:hypothetical protein